MLKNKNGAGESGVVDTSRKPKGTFPEGHSPLGDSPAPPQSVKDKIKKLNECNREMSKKDLKELDELRKRIDKSQCTPETLFQKIRRGIGLYLLEKYNDNTLSDKGFDALTYAIKYTMREVTQRIIETHGADMCKTCRHGDNKGLGGPCNSRNYLPRLQIIDVGNTIYCAEYKKIKEETKNGNIRHTSR